MDWEEWKSIQHSKSVEGFDIGDRDLKIIALDYEAQGYSSLPKNLSRW